VGVVCLTDTPVIFLCIAYPFQYRGDPAFFPPVLTETSWGVFFGEIRVIEHCLVGFFFFCLLLDLFSPPPCDGEAVNTFPDKKKKTNNPKGGGRGHRGGGGVGGGGAWGVVATFGLFLTWRVGCGCGFVGCDPTPKTQKQTTTKHQTNTQKQTHTNR